MMGGAEGVDHALARFGTVGKKTHAKYWRRLKAEKVLACSRVEGRNRRPGRC